MSEVKHLPECEASPEEDCTCEEVRYGKVFWISIGLLALEVAGGLVSGSFSLLSDSIHVASDSVSSFISRRVARTVRRSQLAKREELQLRVFWMRVCGFVLLVFLGWILVESISRFWDPEPVIAWVAVPIAIIGALGNRRQIRILESEVTPTAAMQRKHLEADLQSNYYAIAGTGLSGLASLSGFEFSFVFDTVFALVIVWRIAPDTIRMMLQGGDGHDHGHSPHGHSH